MRLRRPIALPSLGPQHKECLGWFLVAPGWLAHLDRLGPQEHEVKQLQ